MREIEFRAKDITDKWCYGQLIIGRNYNFIITDEDYDEVVATLSTLVCQCHPIKKDNSTVGQFTGLQDKNGNKIFEGDILEWKYNNAPSDYYECIWLDEECCFTFKNIKYEDSFYNPLDLYDEEYSNNFILEVIGNIYDNPELLGDK